MKITYLKLLCCLPLMAEAVVPRAAGEQAEATSIDTGSEISQLEEQRVSDLLLCLRLLVEQRDYTRAGDTALRILITPPSKPAELGALRELVRHVVFGLLRSQKTPEKAAELCEKAVEALGEDALLFDIASLAYKELANESKEKECHEKAKSVRGKDREAWFGMGSFFAEKREFRTALKGFEAAAAISPERPTHYSADSEAAIVSIYCRLGDYEEALRHCKNLEAIARKIAVARTSLAGLTAMVYAEKAREKEIEGKYEEAIQDYTRAAEVSPHPAGAYVAIGELHLRMENYKEAQKCFALAAEAGFPMAHAGLGDILKAQGKPDDAEKEYAACEKLFSDLIDRNPDDASRYNDLAWFYATRDRKLDKGAELARKALVLSPDSPEYLDTLAELYYRKGDREAATREIEKAIALNPPHIRYYQKQLEKFQKGEGERSPELSK